MAGEASRLNGKKGGRPKGFASIEADKAREYFAKKVAENLPAIIEVLMEKAIVEKDTAAIRELLDRGFGRPAQSVEVSSKSVSVVITPELLKLSETYEQQLKDNDTPKQISTP